MPEAFDLQDTHSDHFDAASIRARRARWQAKESEARRAPGHVYSICGTCGEAWMSAVEPVACRRCGKEESVSTTRPCPGCETCVIPPGTTDETAR